MSHTDTRIAVRMWVIALLVVGALLLSPTGVRGAEAAPAAGCRVRVILGLEKAMPPPPDDAWVQALAAANGVELRYLRAITPRLYVFHMTAVGGDGACDAAIARLRGDSRLRSAQIDQRREHDRG